MFKNPFQLSGERQTVFGLNSFLNPPKEAAPLKAQNQIRPQAPQAQPQAQPPIQSNLQPQQPSSEANTTPPWLQRVQGYRPQPEFAAAWQGIDPKRQNDMLGWQPQFREAYLYALSNPDTMFPVPGDTPDQADYELTGTQLAAKIWDEARADATYRSQQAQSQNAAAISKFNYYHPVVGRYV